MGTCSDPKATELRAKWAAKMWKLVSNETRVSRRCASLNPDVPMPVTVHSERRPCDHRRPGPRRPRTGDRGGRAPETRIGTGAAPEPPKTPLGLLGLVVVAGGSRTARYWAVYPGDTRVRASCGIAVSCDNSTAVQILMAFFPTKRQTPPGRGPVNRTAPPFISSHCL